MRQNLIGRNVQSRRRRGLRTVTWSEALRRATPVARSPPSTACWRSASRCPRSCDRASAGIAAINPVPVAGSYLSGRGAAGTTLTAKGNLPADGTVGMRNRIAASRH